MQDDVYSVAMDGWKAGNEYERLVVKGKKDKNGKAKADKEIPGLAGIAGRMISPDLLIATCFQAEQAAITEQENLIESAKARLTEIEEEQNSEDGLFADLEKVNATEINKLLKQLKPTKSIKATKAVALNMVADDAVENEAADNFEIQEEYLQLDISIKKANAEIKQLNAALEKAVLAKYPTLSEADIKHLVIERKWQSQLEQALKQEQEKISQNLTGRIKALADRYAITLTDLQSSLSEVEGRVLSHLIQMGLTW